MKKSEESIYIKAKLTLKKPEEGGRQNGIISGYRPNHVFEYNDIGLVLKTFVGEITFNNLSIEPGETKEVTVRFATDQPIEKYLHLGRKWWVYEGERVVGEAEII